MANKLLRCEAEVLAAMIMHLDCRTLFQNLIDFTFFTKLEHGDIYNFIVSKKGLSPKNMLMEIEHSKLMSIDEMNMFIDYVDECGVASEQRYSINEMIRFKRMRDITAAYESIDKQDPCEDDISKLESVIKLKEQHDLIFGDINDCYSSIATQHRNKIEGVKNIMPTGLDFFDNLIGGGIIKGSTIISGRGGAGKTSLVLQIINKFGETHKDKVNFFFSGEVAYENIAQKVVSHTAKINIGNIQKMKLTKDDSINFTRESGVTRDNVFFVEVNAFCVNDALLIIDRISKREGKKVGLVCFDYLQLMKPNDKSIKDKNSIVDEISANIRDCGKIYRTIAISNMTKGGDSNAGEPSVKDLKGSSNIEYDATAIIMLWKEKEDNNKEILAKIIKNRFGVAPQYAPLNFYGNTGTFESRVSLDIGDYKPSNDINENEWDGF